jgi:hypothetical protein
MGILCVRLVRPLLNAVKVPLLSSRQHICLLSSGARDPQMFAEPYVVASSISPALYFIYSLVRYSDAPSTAHAWRLLNVSDKRTSQ